MRLILKTLLYLVGFIVVLLAGIAIYLTQFFDANQYKPQILEAAESAGVPLEINGELNVTVFPRIGLNINEVAVKLPDEAKTTLASVNQVAVFVKVMPLFSGSVEVDRVIVDKLEADLVVDKSGVGNWQALIPESTETATDADSKTDTAASDSSADNAESSPAALPAIAIGGIDITNARLSFTDQQQDMRFAVKELNFTSDNVQLGESFPIEFSTQVSSSNPQLDATLQLSARVLADLDKQLFRLNSLDLQLNANSPLIPGNKAQLTVQADAEANLQQDMARFNASKIGVNGINIALNTQVNKLTTAPAVKGDLKISQFNLKETLAQLEIALPEMARKDAMNALALSANFEASTEAAAIKDLLITLDDTTIKGAASVQLANQAIVAQLDIDKLNADSYLPPVKEEEAAAEETAPAEPAPETDLLPVELIKTLNADAKINLNQLTIKKLDISDIQLAVTAKDGVVDLSKANAKLYDGSITNTARLDVRPTPLTISFKHATSGVQITPILAQMVEFEDVTGAVNASANFTTKTNRVSTLMSNLNGKVDFDIRNGAFLGTNLAKEMCSALGDAKSAQWSPNTNFTSLKGSMVFKNGVGQNKDMTIATPGILLTGYGNLNLPKETFAYNMGAQITDANDKVCTVKSNFKAVRWPVACKGSYGTPFDINCGLDSSAIGDTIAKIAEAEAKAALDAEKARLKAEADAEKARLEAEAKAKLEAEKAAARKKAEEAAKKKLKSLF
ncbi:AsmA family protein [Oceanospirillum sanctuarii]|uniref:AsmA family protein n=1 Tax=Oceanospirillum sanctuarii TaxID=1434821 RepID=UPI0015947343|nr:AsmA family protein [Oceanospirillum sanctuarii]